MAQAVLTPVGADEIQAEVAEAHQELMPLADQALDYPPLSQLRDQLSLATLLFEHGTKIYRPDDVKAYKQAKIDEVMKPLKRWASLALVISVITFAPLLPMLFYCLSKLDAWEGKHWGEPTPLLPITPFLCLLTVAIVTVIWAVISDSRVKRTTASWSSYALTEFDTPIPLPVLRLAAMIHAAEPRATFRVEEFDVERKPMDPLLYIELKDAEFCIAAWDEPNFNAQPI